MATLSKRIKQRRSERQAADTPLLNIKQRMVEIARQEINKFKSEIKQELQALLREAIGEKGALTLKGDAGFTPQRGRDFLTVKEMAEIKKELRPVKGRDFFDGIPGEPGKRSKGPTSRELKRIVLKVISKERLVDPDKFAEKLVEAFENLKGEARLDYLALKNLPHIPSGQLRTKGKFGGRGGGMGDTQHERFAINTSTLTVKTAFPIGNVGNAISKCAYQGQMLDKDAHFTVASDQQTISFSSGVKNLFRNNTILSVTYTR